MLDLYTIPQKMGSIGGSHIAMVGDLAQGCTVRSLAYLLSKFQNIRIYFVAPPLLKMKEDIPGHLRERNSWYAEATNLDHVLAKVNVVYQMWIQKERFAHRIVK
jgi:aspartate carbamoyltransferase catalytic subunit